MPNNIFITEREGQLHFFKNFGIKLDENDVLIANTDGIYNGNIFEFKLSINNTQQVLFQAIKYLSRLRITGNPVPKNILLISLNQTKVYIFDSGDYFDEIHQIYYGGASKNNDGFTIKKQPKELNYSNMIDADKILKLLKENYFTKIKIDEDCIVGWAEKFYRENPTAKKSDYLDDKDGGEIRKPIKFKDYILPFKEKTNIKFKYLMDKLNDNLIKKELGSFFTPPVYAKKAVELVREAIKLVPKGNDYIILDRCAGTGNLQAELSEEELSHTIVSTLEYYEYKILLERFNGRVRHIIPPTEDNVEFSAGFVTNADALSQDFINNKIIKQYIDNPKCTVILFENPRMLSNLFRTAIYNGNGFYLRSDNYLEKLPLFVVGKYPIEDKWYENGIIFKSSDRGDKYTKDKDFLKSCFVFTCLSRYNKCISFSGSDKRFYKNELCFDKGTLANDQLEKIKLNAEEKELIRIWESILKDAKKTKKYDKKFAYGPYQIETELNTFKKDDNDRIVYDYPTLNGELENLKKKLKTYYSKYITPKLFKYELLK